MKITALLLSMFLLSFSGIASAQSEHNNSQKNINTVSGTVSVKTDDPSVLDKLQKETEDISVIKPLLFIASIIQGRIDLHRMEKESIMAARVRESSNR